MIDPAKIEKAVNLSLQQVAVKQIAMICGLTEVELGVLQQSEAFQTLLAQKTEAQVEEAHLTDRSWDTVEQLALTNLINQLRCNSDPMLALKAGMIANKAMRRQTPDNKPLQAMNAGARVFVSLNQNFLVQLQQKGLSSVPQAMLEARAKSVLSPMDVETTLGSHKTASELLLSAVPEMAAAE